MIEGMKVTVVGAELRDLCIARAEHHAERVKFYAEYVERMTEEEIESKSNMTGGDPRGNAKNMRLSHENDERELRFVAAHLDLKETYILDRRDLHQLGITKAAY